MCSPPTKKEVVAALANLSAIARPEGDNEGDPINSAGVYNYLAPEDQKRVDHAEQITNEYLRKLGDDGVEPNRRSITELQKAGYASFLQPDRDDPCKLVGRVKVADWELDISDGGQDGNN
jgi:hypothetical protein